MAVLSTLYIKTKTVIRSICVAVVRILGLSRLFRIDQPSKPPEGLPAEEAEDVQMVSDGEIVEAFESLSESDEREEWTKELMEEVPPIEEVHEAPDAEITEEMNVMQLPVEVAPEEKAPDAMEVGYEAREAEEETMVPEPEEVTQKVSDRAQAEGYRPLEDESEPAPETPSIGDMLEPERVSLLDNHDRLASTTVAPSVVKQILDADVPLVSGPEALEQPVTEDAMTPLEDDGESEPMRVLDDEEALPISAVEAHAFDKLGDFILPSTVPTLRPPPTVMTSAHRTMPLPDDLSFVDAPRMQQVSVISPGNTMEKVAQFECLHKRGPLSPLDVSDLTVKKRKLSNESTADTHDDQDSLELASVESNATDDLEDDLRRVNETEMVQAAGNQPSSADDQRRSEQFSSTSDRTRGSGVFLGEDQGTVSLTDVGDRSERELGNTSGRQEAAQSPQDQRDPKDRAPVRDLVNEREEEHEDEEDDAMQVKEPRRMLFLPSTYTTIVYYSM